VDQRHRHRDYAIHDADHVRQAVNMNYTIPVHVAALLLSAYIPLFALR
jgi:hypothetical protein